MQPWHLHFFCVEVQMLHHHQSYRSFLTFSIVLCHHLPDVMLSLSRCVFSAGPIISEVQAGGHSQCNAVEFWHARGPSGLARLAKDLICVPAAQTYVERIFFVCGLLFSRRRSAMLRFLEIRVCLKLKPRVLKLK